MVRKVSEVILALLKTKYLQQNACGSPIDIIDFPHEVEFDIEGYLVITFVDLQMASESGA